MNTLKAFLKDQSGAVAMEYASIGVLIAVLLIPAVTAIGNYLIGMLEPVSAALI